MHVFLTGVTIRSATGRNNAELSHLNYLDVVFQQKLKYAALNCVRYLATFNTQIPLFLTCLKGVMLIP